jgi:hypothetical protein
MDTGLFRGDEGEWLTVFNSRASLRQMTYRIPEKLFVKRTYPFRTVATISSPISTISNSLEEG